MSTTKLHDYIYNIEMAQIESELDVSMQLYDTYAKAANILEYYNGNDLSSFKIFNDDYSSDNIIQEGKIMDDVKKQSNGKSTLNKIFFFIPRLLKSLFRWITGQLSDENHKKAVELYNSSESKSKLKGVVNFCKEHGPYVGLVGSTWLLSALNFSETFNDWYSNTALGKFEYKVANKILDVPVLGKATTIAANTASNAISSPLIIRDKINQHPNTKKNEVYYGNELNKYKEGPKHFVDNGKVKKFKVDPKKVKMLDNIAESIDNIIKNINDSSSKAMKSEAIVLVLDIKDSELKTNFNAEAYINYCKQFELLIESYKQLLDNIKAKVKLFGNKKKIEAKGLNFKDVLEKANKIQELSKTSTMLIPDNGLASRIRKSRSILNMDKYNDKMNYVPMTETIKLLSDKNNKCAATLKNINDTLTEINNLENQISAKNISDLFDDIEATKNEYTKELFSIQEKLEIGNKFIRQMTNIYHELSKLYTVSADIFCECGEAYNNITQYGTKDFKSNINTATGAQYILDFNITLETFINNLFKDHSKGINPFEEIINDKETTIKCATSILKEFNIKIDSKFDRLKELDPNNTAIKNKIDTKRKGIIEGTQKVLNDFKNDIEKFKKSVNDLTINDIPKWSEAKMEDIKKKFSELSDISINKIDSNYDKIEEVINKITT